MIKYFRSFSLILVLCWSIDVHIARSTTIIADSCSESDVKKALVIASDGDIVKVPEGFNIKLACLYKCFD